MRKVAGAPLEKLMTFCTQDSEYRIQKIAAPRDRGRTLEKKLSETRSPNFFGLIFWLICPNSTYMKHTQNSSAKVKDLG